MARHAHARDAKAQHAEDLKVKGGRFDGLGSGQTGLLEHRSPVLARVVARFGLDAIGQKPLVRNRNRGQERPPGTPPRKPYFFSSKYFRSFRMVTGVTSRSLAISFTLIKPFLFKHSRIYLCLSAILVI